MTTRRQATVQTTNTSTALSTLIEAALSDYIRSSEVVAYTMTCEVSDARISMDGTSAATGHILYVGQSLRFENNDDFVGARVISKTEGSAATLRVTLEYLS